MRNLSYIWLLWGFVLAFVVPVSAQEIDSVMLDSLIVDTIALDSIDPDPEWYVAPLVREENFAPQRANAANCPVDSVRTFNVDSILTEVTVYEYGDTTRTMVWTINADGSRIGKSRTESASTATTSYSATFAWDNTTNDWKGTTKTENVYNAANKMVSNTVFTWINNDWMPDTRYVYNYDASNREIEYIYYTRNTTTNELVPNKSRIQEWYNNSKKTFEIQYTAHNGTAWSAGTKKVYDYDASGNQIEYTYYSSLSNGNWVGSTHEVWVYTGGKKTYYEKQTWSNGTWVNSTKEIWAFNAAGKQTLHEKYNGSNSTWTLALQENSGYDEAGNNTLIENYSLTNNVWTGTKKEEYTFNAAKKKTGTFTYKWTNGAWVYNQWSVSEYDAAGNATETCKYNWKNEAWVGTGTRTLQTFNSNKKVTEKITQSWPTNAMYWINKTCTTTVYSGANITQEEYYTWQNDAWLGTKRSDYHYNAKNQNDTIKTYTNDGTDWIYSNRTVKTFNAAGTNIMTHNAKWQDNAWVMTSMTRTDISDITVDGIRQTLNASWRCGTDSAWIGIKKDTVVYTSKGKILYEAHYTSWANNNWVPSYKIDNAYDEADRTLREQRFDWTNNSWQGRYWYDYQYDERGNRTSYAVYSGWSSTYDNWTGSTKVEDTYNSKDLRESEILYTWQNNDWLPLFSYHYAYDDLNHEIDKIVMAYNDGTWSNSTHSVKEYKGSQLVKSYEYKWLNSQWTLSSLSESYYDEDAQAKLRQKIEGRWSNGNVTSFTNNLYSYACDPKYYTIRFVNYDGTELSSESIVEGQTPSYSGTEPTKQSDAEYTYTFSGWTPSVVSVTGNATYTATFTGTKRSYTITWLNEDGSEIEHETLEYGATPAHANINKESTSEFTYTFAGWTPGIGIVTGDATYTAQFSASKNSYYITWLNDDNTQIDQTLVEYGVVPTHTAPTKEATDEHSYFFAGWTPEVVAVTGEATYKATYTETTKVYTIIWLNEDGSEISHESLEYGATPSHTAPTKDATAEYTYTFAGWNPAVTSVTSDASYTATFTATKRSYTITWLDEDGSELSHETLEYGAIPQHADATKENTAEYTYSFIGWSPEITSVTSDATYTAQFTASKNSYYITWLNDDNTQIDQTLVEYGVVPTHTAPTKEATDEHSYFFDKWTPDVVAVTGEATYKATYTETTKVYTITWLNENGTEIEHQTLEYGANPTHVDPTKEATDEFTYTFAGWNPAVTSVIGDASYTATFSQTKRSYTITWLNEDGTEISHETLEYGAIPQHTDATKENTAEWSYSFIGWSPDIQSVTGDAAYTAQFNATKNSYYITWLNDDNTQLDQTLVEYGVVPTHTAPTKEATDEHSYFFAGWTPEVVAVTGEATYKATFTETTKVYTITWLNEDGSELGHETLEYGATPQHANPSKESTAEFTYTFAGWTPGIGIVTGDATYTATFNAIKNKYTITFKNEDGSDLQISEVEYGTTPTYNGVEPGKAATAQYTYTFAGWDKIVVPVVGEATYIAQFIATVNKYTITFKNEDGSILSTQTLNYGAMPISMELAKQADAQYTYTFAGWSPSIVPVTGNATYTATYTATKRSYTITWLNENGTEIEHETLEYGLTPQHADASKQSTAEYTYTFTGWSPALASVTGEATYKATYSATKNSYTITFKNDDGTTLNSQAWEYGATPTCTPPTKENTSEYTYTFSGWSPAITSVTGEATYTAVFSETYHPEASSFTIIFYFEDGVTELDRVTVGYGEMPSTTLTPSKTADAECTYTFAGWTPEIVPATANASYTATYTRVMNQYTVTFKNYNGQVLQRSKVDYGAIPEYTAEEPSKPANAQYTFAFSGWNPELTAVTANTTYTAVFESVIRTFLITFYDEDGETVLDEVTVDYGKKPSTSVTPTKPDDEQYTYTVAGWTPKIVAAKSDASYRATYTAHDKHEGLDAITNDQSPITNKIMIDNHIYILRGDKTYTLDGQLVE